MSDEEFEEVFALHFERIRRYLARRVDRAHVDDLAAETFLVLWRRRSAAPRGADVLPWLTRTAQNLLANHYRRSVRERALVGEIRVRSDLPSTGSPGIDAALAELGDIDREVLLLSVWDDLSGEEIAQVVGLSVNAVHLRLSRTRRRLRELLESSDADALPATKPTIGSFAGEEIGDVVTGNGPVRHREVGGDDV